MSTLTYQTIQLGEMPIQVTTKNVKNVHLTVHPPDGRVSLVAPASTSLEAARNYAITKLDWIHRQQEAFAAQARETPREFIGRESHFLWGHRYLLVVEYKDAKPSITLDHKQITLTIRPDTSTLRRAEIFHEWHKELLYDAVWPLILKWRKILDIFVADFYIQRMKTRWGSCNAEYNRIRINTELVKKPKHLLEYVVVHETLHIIEPDHNARFIYLLDQHFPAWRDCRRELNELPLSAENWRE